MVSVTPLIIRPGREADLPLVYDSWSRSFGPQRHKITAYGDRWVGIKTYPAQHRIAPGLFHRGHRLLVAELLEQASLIVGHFPGAPEVVAAWAAVLPSDSLLRVHYIWTRDAVRRRGYATELLQHAAQLAPGSRVRFTHLTPNGEALFDAWQRSRHEHVVREGS